MRLIDPIELKRSISLSTILKNDKTLEQIIDEQPTIEECKWIPCSERLPENDDWKIITIRDENADRPYIYSDFGWYLAAADCWIVDAEQRRDIIAWMPLPKPYEYGTKMEKK